MGEQGDQLGLPGVLEFGTSSMESRVERARGIAELGLKESIRENEAFERAKEVLRTRATTETAKISA